MLSPASTLAQALLYADSVTLMAPQSDDLLETSDWWQVVELFGSAIQRDSLDGYGYVYSKDEERSLPFLKLLVVEANALLAMNEDRLAFKKFRQAQVALTHFRPHKKKKYIRSYPTDLNDLVEQTLTGDGPALSRVNAFLRLHGSRISQLRGLRGATESELTKVERLVGVFEFTQRSLAANAYPLVDDARGYWRGAAAQNMMLSGSGQKRAANASLAVGQIQRLPSIRAMDWFAVKDVREGLRGPLIRFRSAMSKLSVEATVHPLDASFDDFVEEVWLTSVAPAIEEVEELSRQAQFRAVFFDDVLGKLSTYSSPAIALAAANFASMPLALQAALGLAAPAANAIAAIRTKQRALASKDFMFLRLVEKRAARA
ncbi:hypothetical protein ACIP9X_02965 [Arthrobacter sp. NPDC093125]|uniref:hypothetical protein n=1 Tax=Arthrobacter sp. NPDC093125 TaxID=3363944 RepID=UPI003814E2DD